jgi:hypothetical protein
MGGDEILAPERALRPLFQVGPAKIRAPYNLSVTPV